MYKNIYFFVGTTAELIKLAPVMREFKAKKIKFHIIASNQNVLHFGELKPLLGKTRADHILKIKINKNIKNIYIRFMYWLFKTVGNYYLYFRREFVKVDKKSSIVIVHGDTVSALMGAVVARLNGVKLVHIESGLRSKNFLEPFPEEISRFVISWLAHIHFAPNSWSLRNLKGKPGKKVSTKYNTVSEAINLAIKEKVKLKIVEKNKKYFVLVIHRQEHTMFNKNSTQELIRHFQTLASAKLKCVFIMHKLTRDYLKKQNMLNEVKRNPDFILSERLPYPQFISLIKNSEFIATDGGSNQEEAYFLGIPCLILRRYTERIEGLGKNAVLSKLKKEIIKDFAVNYKDYKRQKVKIKRNPSKIIVNTLTENV